MNTEEHRRHMSTGNLRPNTVDSHRNTDMMKFVNENNSKTKPVGRKCHPEQMFGISKEAPD